MQPLAEFVAEMATVPPEEVVVGDNPVPLQPLQDPFHLCFGLVCLSHGDRLLVNVAFAPSRKAAEDTGVVPVLRLKDLTVGPFGTVDLDSTMKSARAKGKEQ
eukprot:CAMPEP_0194749142 /NCGR_PEP_ID=MMETSP0323_2-20130528/3344_1 /TAXON_ID=2866 ORGANISM="Crypthecodinium cohnii, Strain Seligo" /NCGR_SAMPLE_ID=MMETSP0323_2 /ASSEMBLY_ACC=CAM_ASM_000346 /LENGTH=101 /DNA_ID=CAMNT_0039664023 /DNA_START=440 /DNA_END=742 /DNA_ORIENTATION=+